MHIKKLFAFFTLAFLAVAGLVAAAALYGMSVIGSAVSAIVAVSAMLLLASLSSIHGEIFLVGPGWERADCLGGIAFRWGFRVASRNTQWHQAERLLIRVKAQSEQLPTLLSFVLIARTPVGIKSFRDLSWKHMPLPLWLTKELNRPTQFLARSHYSPEGAVEAAKVAIQTLLEREGAGGIECKFISVGFLEPSPPTSG